MDWRRTGRSAARRTGQRPLARDRGFHARPRFSDDVGDSVSEDRQSHRESVGLRGVSCLRPGTASRPSIASAKQLSRGGCVPDQHQGTSSGNPPAPAAGTACEIAARHGSGDGVPILAPAASPEAEVGCQRQAGRHEVSELRIEVEIGGANVALDVPNALEGSGSLRRRRSTRMSPWGG